ncbi:MAG: cytochrome B [Bacteroidota bacterium]
MYTGLKHAHSGLRWIFLALLIYAVVNAFIKWRNGSAYTEGDRKIGLFTFITSHIQLVIGLILYFISPKVGSFSAEVMKEPVARFFTVEHLTVMLLGIILITIGYSKAKRALEGTQKFKTTFIFFAIGLVLILSRIPWPWQQYGAGWG